MKWYCQTSTPLIHYAHLMFSAKTVGLPLLWAINTKEAWDMVV